MTDKILAYSTCASAEEASKIARRLLDARLAACVSITQPIRSLYHWQDKIEDENEFLLIIKSRRDLVEALKSEIRAAHSYVTPELIVVPIVDGLPDYLDWIDRELGGPR